MTEEDRDYLCRRADEEIGWAQASASEQLVKFHYQLASLYLDRVYNLGARQDSAAAAD